MGPVSLAFKDSVVEVDFGRDSSVEAKSHYVIKSDTIYFVDIAGAMCPDTGVYKMYRTDHYCSFDLISDMCNGRIKATMGFWVYPGFQEQLKNIDDRLGVDDPDPMLYLNRARMNMAMGKPNLAKPDFDIYLLSDSSSARVFINRAGTRFPHDMQGAIWDCNKALELDPQNKNAYFLRGLALYSIGKERAGCDDFKRAIELGFEILKIAEKERCAEYWNTYPD